MVLRLLMIASVMMLASCAVSFTQIRGPDGRRDYVMNCSGIDVNRSDCARLARKLCPRGYRLVDPNSVASGANGRRYAAMLADKSYVTISCT
ncbi:MAG: hypothetical protein ACXWLV_08925 [Rhizomicrobium sp.]|jgi:hypothetical protein